MCLRKVTLQNSIVFGVCSPLAMSTLRHFSYKWWQRFYLLQAEPGGRKQVCDGKCWDLHRTILAWTFFLHSADLWLGNFLVWRFEPPRLWFSDTGENSGRWVGLAETLACWTFYPTPEVASYTQPYLSCSLQALELGKWSLTSKPHLSLLIFTSAWPGHSVMGGK